MLILLLTIVIIAVAMGAMAIGVAVTKRPLKGSCGGIGNACECASAGIKSDDGTCARTGKPLVQVPLHE